MNKASARARQAKKRAWHAVVRDLLSLVDVQVDIPDLWKRTTAEVLAAEKWAALEHLHANDNEDVERVPKPAWLPKSETEKRLEAAKEDD